MCRECWEEIGCPEIDSAAVRKAIELIERVYEFHCAGGGLHVIVDDFNCDDDSIKFCDEWIERHRPGPEQYAAERACLDLLSSMTIDERMSALAARDGFYVLDQTS